MDAVSDSPTTGAVATPLAMSIIDPARRADPYTGYQVLRETDPLHRTLFGERQVTLVSRYRDCAAVLASPVWGHGYDLGINPFRPGVKYPDEVPGSFLLMDPPDHTRLRSLVSKAFTPRVIAGLRPDVIAAVGTLLDAALAAGTIDLISDFARPLPLRVICGLLGVPPEDEERFGVWTAAISRGVDPDYTQTPLEIAQRADAAREFGGYFMALIADRRSHPKQDLLSRLAAVHDEGDLLSEDELLAVCALLLVGGYETTLNLVANGVLALLRHPAQLAALRADPGLMTGAVDEILRYDPPGQLTTRVALRETDIDGRSFGRGDGVVVLMGSAHRDRDVFVEPDRFDITRYAGPSPASRHLAFGLGAHYCLGAPLARMEAEIALESLIQRAPGLALEAEPSYRPNLAIRGVDTLRVRLLP